MHVNQTSASPLQGLPFSSLFIKVEGLSHTLLGTPVSFLPPLPPQDAACSTWVSTKGQFCFPLSLFPFTSAGTTSLGCRVVPDWTEGYRIQKVFTSQNQIFEVLLPKTPLTIRLTGISYWLLTLFGRFQRPTDLPTVPPPGFSPLQPLCTSQVLLLSDSCHLTCRAVWPSFHLPNFPPTDLKAVDEDALKIRPFLLLRGIRMPAITNSSQTHTLIFPTRFGSYCTNFYKLHFFHQYFSRKIFFSVIINFPTAWF